VENKSGLLVGGLHNSPKMIGAPTDRWERILKMPRGEETEERFCGFGCRRLPLGVEFKCIGTPYQFLFEETFAE
jgi:hypothetical protein